MIHQLPLFLGTPKSPSSFLIIFVAYIRNRSAENLYGWKHSEVIGKRMDQLLVSQEQHAQLENILEGLNFEQPWSGQFPFKRQTGEIFMAMTTKSLLYEDGELTGVITVSSDATHFNCVNLEHQRSNQERANGLPKGPSLNSKRIQWHPQSVAVPQIVSSVSNLVLTPCIANAFFFFDSFSVLWDNFFFDFYLLFSVMSFTRKRGVNLYLKN